MLQLNKKQKKQQKSKRARKRKGLTKTKTKTLSRPKTKILTQTHTNTRGDKRSKEAQLRIMTDIQSLLPKHSDSEIMDILRIPNETYYRYKDRLYEESKNLWQKTRTEDLEYRALNILSYLQKCTRVNEEIALDKGFQPKDRIEASEKMVNAQLKIYLLLRDGPELDSK